MIILRLFIMIILIVPVLFVIGTIASSADMIGPLPVGACEDVFFNIAQAGKGLRAATESMALKEIELLEQIVQNLQSPRNAYQETESRERAESLLETSI